MPISTRRRAFAAAVLGSAALVLLAACTTSASLTTSRPTITWTTGTSAPPTSSSERADPDRDANPTTGRGAGGTGRDTPASSTPRASTTPSVIRLGRQNPPPTAEQVGAPFDPCRELAWRHFPEKLRPRAARPPRPIPRTPLPSSVYDIACSLTIDGTTTISGGTTQGPSGELSTWIVWGADMPAVPEGTTPTTLGPARGALMPRTTASGTPMCTGTAQLRNGVAGVSIVNGRAPDLDTCQVVADLLTRITTEHA